MRWPKNSTSSTYKLQRGQSGELTAQFWFKKHGWHMTRTQPAIQILGTAPGKHFGRTFTVRMIGRRGVPDFTGWSLEITQSDLTETLPVYRAVEVKEQHGETMPCSVLDKNQRAFMDALPPGCAYVGILWDNGLFEVHDYKAKGAYVRGKGLK